MELLVRKPQLARDEYMKSYRAYIHRLTYLRDFVQRQRRNEFDQSSVELLLKR